MNKKSFKKLITSKIETIGPCENLELLDPDFYKQLVSLFQNHPDSPEKIKGLKNISIRPNWYRKLGLYILTDHGEDDISYVACIEGKTPSQKYKDSPYRKAITEQILQFKMKVKDWKCVECSSENTDFHVDHIYPFSCLLQDFFATGNKEFEDWKVYHQEHAELQLLCAKCNLKKGSKVNSCLID